MVAALGVRIEAAHRWAREGVIPAAKLGNRGGFHFKHQDREATRSVQPSGRAAMRRG